MKFYNDAYVCWSKHYSDFDVRQDVFKSSKEMFEITVHPFHELVRIDRNKRFEEQIIVLEKSTQMYLCSFIWGCYVSEIFHLEFIDFFDKFISLFSVMPEKFPKRLMVWDDHAVSERACVALHFMKHSSIVQENDELKNRFTQHILLCRKYLIEVIKNEDRWENNNHKIFHIMSLINISHFFGYDAELKYYINLLDDFLLRLFDIKTGFSLEQSVGYLSFDMILVRKVIDSLKKNNIILNKFNYGNLHTNFYNHMAALAFPDGSVVASGDTALGKVNIKKDIIKELYKKDIEELYKYFRNLDLVGYHRGKSVCNNWHFNILTHNAESAHGHHSPLHIDLWVNNFGLIFCDSGGPFLYGNKLRHEWFRAHKGHNCLSYDGISDERCNFEYCINYERNIFMGIVKYDSCEHKRIVEVSELGCKITDIVLSNNNYELNYHFPPDSILEFDHQLSVFRLSRDNKEVRIKYSSKGSFEINDTYRCTTGRDKILCPSLIFKNKKEYNISIIDVFQNP